MPVSLPGRWLDPAGVERDCTVRGETIDALEVSCEEAPPPGSRVVCRVPGLGTLLGRSGQSIPTGFHLEIHAAEEGRRRLSARLRWHGARA